MATPRDDTIHLREVRVQASPGALAADGRIGIDLAVVLDELRVQGAARLEVSCSELANLHDGSLPPTTPRTTEQPTTTAAGPLHNVVVKLLARLVSAVGVGAIFGHKAQQEAHWSEAEHWIAGAETDDAITDGS